MGDRITYVGHGTVLIEIAGTRLLTDPVFRERFLHVRRHAPEPDPAAKEAIDAVLISHLHADHLDLPSVRSLGDAVPVIASAGARGVLRRRRISGIIGLDAGESTTVGGVKVTATRAVHDGRRYPLGRSIDALGYAIRSSERAIYFAGDTDLFDEMSELGPIDVALLPIGGWGPRVGSGHLNPERAAEAAARIKPRVVVPIHWGTYLRAGLDKTRPELLRRYPEDLARELAGRAPGVELQVLEPGESLELGDDGER